MTKKEIVKLISERSKLTQIQSKEIVQWIIDAILDALVEDGRIELRNFGVFEVRQRRGRQARNPRTGEPVNVEPKNVVVFQPGKVMEGRIKQAKVVNGRNRLNPPKPPKPNLSSTPLPPVVEEPIAVGS